MRQSISNGLLQKMKFFQSITAYKQCSKVLQRVWFSLARKFDYFKRKYLSLLKVGVLNDL